MARLKLLQNLECLKDGRESLKAGPGPPWGRGVPRFVAEKCLDSMPSSARRPPSGSSTRCPPSQALTRPSSARVDPHQNSIIGPRPSHRAIASVEQPSAKHEVQQSSKCADAALLGTKGIPDWYQPDGAPSKVAEPLLPEHNLWVTLHGGNGVWHQRKARVAWAQQLVQHDERAREQELLQKNLRMRRAEAERQRKAAEEESRLRVEEAERERWRRQQEEDRLRTEREEMEKRRLEEEERKELLRRPQVCSACGGSGTCRGCSGEGYVLTVYLAETLKPRNGAACGRLPRGCSNCGGGGDGAAWGDFVSGSGRCTKCSGVGRIPAPPGGWPS